MNERIQALAVEAEDYADGIVDQGGEFHPAYTRKLAELIVRECANTIQSNQWAKDNQAWSKGMQYSAELIKEHFGVDK